MGRVAVITSRKGRGKHLWQFRGRPLVQMPIDAVWGCMADGKYIATDCEIMAHLAYRTGIVHFPRLPEESTDTAKHAGIIKRIAETLCEPEDVLVIILGNCPYVTSDIIDQCFETVESGECDACVTVWKAADDHPFRALVTNEDGYIRSKETGPVSSNRQDYPNVYYYDNTVWAMRARCAIEQDGPQPWVWLGQRCKPIVRPWITGRDVHDELDIVVAESILTFNEQSG